MIIFEREPIALTFGDTVIATAADWHCTVLGRQYVIPKGTVTDGMSAPRLLLGITGDRFAPEIIGPSLWHDHRYQSGDCGRLFADFAFGIAVVQSLMMARMAVYLWWMGRGRAWRWLMLPLMLVSILWRAVLATMMTVCLALFGWARWRHRHGAWSFDPGT